MTHVAVAGCGIGGLEAALRLERRGHPVTVVEPDESMLFYPALHHVLGGRPVDHAQIDLEWVFAGRDVRHVQDRVTGRDGNTLQLADTGEVRFNALVVAVGARTQYGTIQGEGNVHDLRFRDDTERIRDELERADVEHVVVVGGGATGVEATASLIQHDRYGDFDVTLLEANDRLLPEFVPALGEMARLRFDRKGVRVRTRNRVREITADAVELDGGGTVDSDLTVWAGGVKPHPVIHDLDLPTTERGVAVDRTLRAAGHGDIYVVGDAADYDGKVNRAYYALGEARTAVRNIDRRSRGTPLRAHEVGFDPNLIQLGPRDAVFEMAGHVLSGIVPYLMRHYGVEKRYLLTRRYML